MSSEKRRIVVLASGTPTGGGSGFEWLVEATRTGVIPNAEVVAVISNRMSGGVNARADRLGIPFCWTCGIPLADRTRYSTYVKMYEPDLTCLSGCLWPISEPDPAKVINIHPGPLPEFGGPGMYGHHVHEAVMAAYLRGKITQSAVTMHFVTEEYDAGPVFFRYPVAIRPDDTAESLGARVNEVEHGWQSFITSLVLNGEIWYNALSGRVIVKPNVHRALHHFFRPGSVVVV